MTEQVYRRLVRGMAAVDLVTSLLFALPWTFSLVIQVLRLLGPLPEFAPLHLLFVYLMGTLCVTWAVVRLARPEPWLGLADGLARCVFGAWQIWFLLVASINPAVWLFAALEIVPAVAVVPLYFRTKKIPRKAGPAGDSLILRDKGDKFQD